MNNTEFNDFVKKMDKLDESISLSAMESLKNYTDLSNSLSGKSESKE